LDNYLDDRSDQPTWFAVCTNAKQEDRAYNNLHAWGVECFNPKIKEYRRNQFTGVATQLPKPLFPRYIFARFSVSRSLHKISFTRGVQRVVSFDDKPIPIDDDVIALLQARVDTNGFMQVGEPLKPGDKVRVKDGPWKALVGVVERELKSNERIMILLDSLKFQSRLTIEKAWVEKIS
jgi:transcriptional antiterminator RfaH